MKRTQPRLIMNIDHETHAKFKSICALSGKSISEVLKELVDVFINAVEKENEN